MNTMDINGCQAVVSYAPDINQFRGEFIEQNDGADFHAADVDALRQEGVTSLRVFAGNVPRKRHRTAPEFFWRVQCTNSIGTLRTSCSGSCLQQQKFEHCSGGEIGGMRRDGFNVSLASLALDSIVSLTRVVDHSPGRGYQESV